MNIIRNITTILASSLLLQTVACAAVSDVDFNGVLVAEPCTVAPGGDGENIIVDFGSIPDKVFYFNAPPRSMSRSFSILLKDCDLSHGSQVKLTFTGAGDIEQPGRLAVSSTNGISHIAVGIQDTEGNDIAINKPVGNYKLNSGLTELTFKAYLQASQNGVRGHSIGNGRFEAVTTFILEYQ